MFSSAISDIQVMQMLIYILVTRRQIIETEHQSNVGASRLKADMLLITRLASCTVGGCFIILSITWKCTTYHILFETKLLGEV